MPSKADAYNHYYTLCRKTYPTKGTQKTVAAAMREVKKVAKSLSDYMAKWDSTTASIENTLKKIRKSNSDNIKNNIGGLINATNLILSSYGIEPTELSHIDRMLTLINYIDNPSSEPIKNEWRFYEDWLEEHEDE